MSQEQTEHRWCLVTGAANGLGRDLTASLAAAGWRVAALDVDADGLAQLTESVPQDSLRTFVADVRDREAVNEVVGQIGQAGELTALVNNAGVISVGSVTEMSQDDWQHVIDVNVTGAFLVAQAVAARMVREGVPGRIVNIGSLGGKLPRWHRVSYCVSKAAIAHMTRVFALELAGERINVNTVSPGSVAGGVVMENVNKGHSSLESLQLGDLERFRLGVPLGCLGTHEDVIGAIHFLLSDAANHITGDEIRVDGGQGMF